MSGRSLILVTGPASSGKSEWAERLAGAMNLKVHYVATAQVNPDDPEWEAKIARHASRRPPEWETLFVPFDLGNVFKSSQASDCFLVDSLGTWVANFLDRDSPTWTAIVTELLTILNQWEGSVIFVAEETGWGIVPAYESGRLFRDRLGNLTRKIGAIASTVYLVTGGYALNLTELGTPIGNI